MAWIVRSTFVALRPQGAGLMRRPCGPRGRRVRWWRSRSPPARGSAAGIWPSTACTGSSGATVWAYCAPGRVAVVQRGEQRLRRSRPTRVVRRPRQRRHAVARREVDGQLPRLLEQQLVLLDELLKRGDGLRVVGRVVARPTGRTPTCGMSEHGEHDERRRQAATGHRDPPDVTTERESEPRAAATRRRCAGIGGQVEVVGEHDLDAVPLPNRDRGQDVEIAIEHARGGGREARAGGLPGRVRERSCRSRRACRIARDPRSRRWRATRRRPAGSGDRPGRVRPVSPT